MAAVVKKMQCRFTLHGNVCTNHTDAHHQHYYHPARKPCNYAGECTSHVAKHPHEYAHPGDRDWPVIPMPRVQCRDAEHCRLRHIPLHRLRFSHPRDQDWPKPPLPAVPSSTRGKYKIGNYVNLGSHFGYIVYIEEKPDGIYYHIDINEAKPVIVPESHVRLQSQWPYKKRWVVLAKGIPQVAAAAAAAVPPHATREDKKEKDEKEKDEKEKEEEEMIHTLFSDMPPDLLDAILKKMGSRRKRNANKKQMSKRKK